MVYIVASKSNATSFFLPAVLIKLGRTVRPNIKAVSSVWALHMWYYLLDSTYFIIFYFFSPHKYLIVNLQWERCQFWKWQVSATANGLCNILLQAGSTFLHDIGHPASSWQILLNFGNVHNFFVLFDLHSKAKSVVDSLSIIYYLSPEPSQLDMKDKVLQGALDCFRVQLGVSLIRQWANSSRI